MKPGAALPLTVDAPTGRADLLVDGDRPLADLMPALAAAVGAPADAGWAVGEGFRVLDPTRSLREQHVCAGSVLHLRR